MCAHEEGIEITHLLWNIGKKKFFGSRDCLDQVVSLYFPMEYFGMLDYVEDPVVVLLSFYR